MIVRRHRLPVRLWHWTNAIAVFVLLMSGLMIFNAHPRLYWGHYGANPDPAWLEIYATRSTGVLRVGDLRVETTGVLGRWSDPGGVSRALAFPHWATIPSTYNLALARRWHIAFAWVLAVAGSLYLVWAAASRHAAALLPTRRELAPGHVWQDIKAHALLRFPRGEAALRYNVLQKLAYGGVVFILLPAIVLSGLGMSPAIDAAWPWVVDLFGGRQSARSVHFISAALILAFIAVHLLMVLLAGPVNGIISMITGRYRIREETP
ncbi:cytochrome b/b6 domain-containing protein [Sphingosinicella soli]|uniref:Thiosulfate reductase cytochrome b subunit n=1 Tax=Sphingosinicella soli TaxID=333708 RepID=A0A7W7B335_9SPHN|nr:cytochrome b/b6 domain-containing protein [Sphingosinicella soli]MBB4632087.1 thiosulfate reductase cytochrome b subunit [Sphingosinicella soli]